MKKKRKKKRPAAEMTDDEALAALFPKQVVRALKSATARPVKTGKDSPVTRRDESTSE